MDAIACRNSCETEEVVDLDCWVQAIKSKHILKELTLEVPAQNFAILNRLKFNTREKLLSVSQLNLKINFQRWNKKSWDTLTLKVMSETKTSPAAV